MATILCVEDDINLAELIKQKLEDEGYQVYIAYTGTQGIKEMNSTNPNVITLDIHLPDVHGVELLKIINKDKKIPVIVVTSDDTVEQEVKNYDADGFVKKPIDFVKLKTIIKSKIK